MKAQLPFCDPPKSKSPWAVDLKHVFGAECDADPKPTDDPKACCYVPLC